MNYRKNIVIILALSIIISLIGFFIDTDVRETSLSVNVLEISMMSIIIAVILSIIYFPISFFVQKLK
ncbi:MAG: hypothetical protein QNK84_07905 [Flavobacteriales bacterium]|tara:strand:+ start:1216 stop:1416 length:201 start_codon:yes stop_codon:yes gene_type:complete